MAIAIKLADWALLTLSGLSFVFLIFGLIKPKWVLFWMKAPNRILVTCIAMLLFMGSWTGHTVLMVKPKQKTERERTQDELNNLNLGPSVKH